MVYRGGRKADNIMTRIIYRLSNGQSVAEWCRQNDVPYGSLFGYLEKGLMVDEACEKAKKAREKYKLFRPTMYKGKTLKSQFPCGYVSIMAHIRNKKCTVEEAVKIYRYNLKRPYSPKNIKAVVDINTGQEWESIKKCAESFNVSPTTLRRRLFQGSNLKYKEK